LDFLKSEETAPMKANFDKEALLKHKFWVLFGTFLLLWLVGVIVLKVGASGALEDNKKKFVQAQKEIKEVPRPKNINEYRKPWEEYGGVYKKNKDVVWKEAWDAQKGMITWPRHTRDELRKLWDNAESFQDWLTKMKNLESTQLRGDYKDTFYVKQFDGLKDYVAPVEFKGSDAGFATLMAPETGTSTGASGLGAPDPRSLRPGVVPGRPGGENATAGRSYADLFKETPTAEEVWLTQEDFWVKQEILHVIRATLDRIAKFKRVDLKGDDAKLPNGAIARYRFQNQHWELDLLIEKDGNKNYISAKSRIKNINPTHRVQPIANPRTKGPLEFRITQGTAEPYILRVKGEPRPFGEGADFGEQLSIDRINLAKDFEISEVLDWSTAPVRRVDQIKIGASGNSHRTAYVTLVANKNIPIEADPSTTTPSGGPVGTNLGGVTPTTPSTPAGPSGPSGSSGATSSGPSPTTEVNQLTRNRYLSVTGQCRHLPLGVVVIVDQAHIHDFLASLASSPLRVQITQVMLQHARGIAPPLPASADMMTPMGPMLPPVGPLGTGKGGDRDRTPPRPPVGPGGPGLPGVGQEEDPNLVELTVYGIAGLFERFPSKKPESSKP
jgi:hypothetical protein